MGTGSGGGSQGNRSGCLAGAGSGEHALMSFTALLVSARGQPAAPTILELAQLPPQELLVRVRYSSLNYKDALAVTATAPVVRAFPMVPGIDLVGTVMESSVAEFRPGDEVLSTGSGLGESVWGGYAGYARVPSRLVVRLAPGLTAWNAMAFGTAGLTAMLCVQGLEARGLPAHAPVVVSGATGGVGSIAIQLLALAGHRVTAISGKDSQHDYLRRLGAAEILPRASLTLSPEKTLLAERWAGGIDTVGGEHLAGMLRGIATGGTVATCGMASGGALPTTVYPFILRGVGLQGIACSICPTAQKFAAWTRLAASVPQEVLAAVTQTITLAQVPDLAARMLASQLTGRVVVNLAP